MEQINEYRLPYTSTEFGALLDKAAGATKDLSKLQKSVTELDTRLTNVESNAEGDGSDSAVVVSDSREWGAFGPEDALEAAERMINNAGGYEDIVSNWDKYTDDTVCLYQYADIIYFPRVDMSNIETMNSMFDACSSLLVVGRMNTYRAKFMNALFNDCEYLRAVLGIWMNSVEEADAMFSNCTSLTEIQLYGFGESPNLMYLDTSQCPWTAGLRDSLLVRSCDRAAAGFDTCEIYLSEESMAYLREEDKEAICAKGYTLIG